MPIASLVDGTAHAIRSEDDLLATMVELGASELHLTVGTPPAGEIEVGPDAAPRHRGSSMASVEVPEQPGSAEAESARSVTLTKRNLALAAVMVAGGTASRRVADARTIEPAEARA